MKKIFTIIAIGAVLLLSGCEKTFEEISLPIGETVTVSAVIPADLGTKTIFDETSHKAFWTNRDSIGVFCYSQKTTNNKFLLSSGEGTAEGTFTGTFANAPSAQDKYIGYYPYKNDGGLTNVVVDNTGGKILLYTSIPRYQRAVTADFSAGLMAAKTSADKSGATNIQFDFVNLQSVLKIEVSGTGFLKYIHFKDLSGKPVSGRCYIDFTGNTPVLSYYDNVSDKNSMEGVLTLDAGSDGVELETAPKSFYLVVPSRVYSSGVSLAFESITGEVMTKTVGQSGGVTFAAGKMHSADAFLSFAKDAVTDLSAYGYSNCYIVQADKDQNTGNSNYKFSTKHVNGTPITGGDAAAYLWTDVECNWDTDAATGVVQVASVVSPKDPEWIIKNISYSDGVISFTATGNKGNAVIALYNSATNEIVWSWHIWVTGKANMRSASAKWQSKHLLESNQSLEWLRCNVGGIPGALVDVRTYGLLYQWGRKDPFVGAKVVGTKDTAASDDAAFGNATMPYLANSTLSIGFDYSTTIGTVAETVKTPMTYRASSNQWATDTPLDSWGDGYSPFTKWEEWATNVEATENYSNGVRRAASGKSNNDPCPVGYRVPTAEELWNSFAAWSATSTYDYTTHWADNITTTISDVTYGRLIKSYADPSNTTMRFPACGYRQSGKMASVGGATYYWTSTIERYDSNKYAYRWLVGKTIRIEGAGNFAVARPVRCVAEY